MSKKMLYYADMNKTFEITTKYGKFIINQSKWKTEGFLSNYKMSINADEKEVAILYYQLAPLNSTGCLNFIFTEKAYENKGYANALLNALIEHCIDNNVNYIYGLFSPVESEEKALSFYKNNGFKIVEDNESDGIVHPKQRKIIGYIPKLITVQKSKLNDNDLKQ